MTTNIMKWGNSQGIRIPKYLLDQIHWSENEQIEIAVNESKDEIIIKRAMTKEPQKSIQELFADYTGTYNPTEIDWGEPQGNEIW